MSTEEKACIVSSSLFQVQFRWWTWLQQKPLPVPLKSVQIIASFEVQELFEGVSTAILFSDQLVSYIYRTQVAVQTAYTYSWILHD